MNRPLQLYNWWKRTTIKSFQHLLSVSKILKSKAKVDARGIVYSYGFARYTSTMVDVLLFSVVLSCIGAIIAPAIDDPKAYRAFQKYSLDHTAHLNGYESTMVRSRINMWLLSQFVQIVIAFISVVYMWVKYSTTPGKYLFGLRIVDAETLNGISLKQAIKRVCFLPISMLCLCVGMIWSSFDKRAQGWHDKVAKTVVVTNKSLMKLVETEER